MPISAADVKIVLSAQDQASGVMKQFGANAEKALREVETSTSRLNGMFTKFRENWLGLTAAAYAAKEVLSKAWELANTAAQFEEQKAGLEALAAQYGTSADQIIQSVKGVVDGQLSLVESSQLASKAMLLGLNPDQIVKFIGYAERLTDVAGGEIPAAFEAMEKAAATGKSKGLATQLGLIVDLKKALEEYAKAHGITTDQIGATTVMQIRANAIMEAAKRKTDQLGESQLSTADKMNVMKAQVADIELWLGQATIKAASGALAGFQYLSAGVLGLTSAYLRYRAMIYGAIGDEKKQAENLLNANAAMEARNALIKEAANSWSVATADPKDLRKIRGSGNPNYEPLGDSAEATKAAARLKEQWEETVRTLNAKIEGGGLDDLRKALIDNATEADALKDKFKALPVKLRDEAYAKIDAARLVKDNDAAAKATEKNRKEAIEGVKKETDEKIKAIEEEKKAALVLKALREGEINARISDLDLAEKEGTAHRETLAERIRLMQELLVIQEDYLVTINKEQDPSSWYAQINAISQTKKAIIDLKTELKKDTVIGGLQQGLADLANSVKSYGELSAEFVQKSFDSMAGALTKWMKTGKFEIEDFADYFIEQFIRIQMQTAALKLFGDGGSDNGWIGQAFSLVAGMFGSGNYGKGLDPGYAMSDQGGGYGGANGGYHSGGLMTEPSFFRVGVNPRIFDTAPRYHSGIGPNETAAIIDKREGVFTPGQMRAMGIMANGGGTTINVPITFSGERNNALASDMRREIEEAALRVIKRHS